MLRLNAAAMPIGMNDENTVASSFNKLVVKIF